MKNSYLSIFLIFLRFGCLAWGGPVAQISMIRDELVDKKGWVTQEKFKRVLAVYQALPGPEAHEICVYFGMLRAGRLGGFLAGLGFMLPGLILMISLSWAYIYYGGSALLSLFIGIAPAVVALIIRAAHRIGKHVLHGSSQILTCIVAALLITLDVHFFLVFLVCGIFQAIFASGRVGYSILTLITLFIICVTANIITSSAVDISSIGSSKSLFLEGLKSGMLSFGGAYTVIPFLEDSMIGAYPAITEQAFLDGIALSNIIPAPLVIFGTFLGFLADGIYGALYVTAGIFLPAFMFTLVGHKHLERIIENKTFHGFLDGVSSAVVGLLCLTALNIFLQVVAMPSHLVIFLFALSMLYLLKGQLSVPLIIILSGILGYIIN